MCSTIGSISWQPKKHRSPSESSSTFRQQKNAVNQLTTSGFSTPQTSPSFSPAPSGTSQFRHREKTPRAPRRRKPPGVTVGRRHRRKPSASSPASELLPFPGNRFPSSPPAPPHGHPRRSRCRRSRGAGLIGALAGLGIPEYEARRYEGRVQKRRHPPLRPLRNHSANLLRAGGPSQRRRRRHRLHHRKRKHQPQTPRPTPRNDLVGATRSNSNRQNPRRRPRPPTHHRRRSEHKPAPPTTRPFVILRHTRKRFVIPSDAEQSAVCKFLPSAVCASFCPSRRDLHLPWSVACLCFCLSPLKRKHPNKRLRPARRRFPHA